MATKPVLICRKSSTQRIQNTPSLFNKFEHETYGCWSFHPSWSSSTLVWSSWYFSWLVFVLSYLTFSGSLHPKFHFIFLKSFLWCTSRFRPWPTSFHSLCNSSWLCHLQELNQIPLYADDTQLYYFCQAPSDSTSSLEILSNSFLWHTLLDATLTNCSSIHPKLNSYSLVQNNNGSNFLNSQFYLSAMISSQSALLLVILASSLILTCHSQIKLTPCLYLVIFISETSVVFVISFLFLQLQRLPIHSSPANFIIVIHSTMAFRKLTWTKFSADKRLWIVSLQIHLNLNTVHAILKKLHWLPIKQRIDYKLCLLTYKTLPIQQPTYLYCNCN